MHTATNEINAEGLVGLGIAAAPGPGLGPEVELSKGPDDIFCSPVAAAEEGNG